MASSNDWANFYAQVNGAALSRYPDILYRWLPAGQVSGNEYECANINGAPGKSCKVNINTGRWADFAGNEKGGDPISLYAEINHLKQGEAAQGLARELGIEPPRLRAVKDSAWKPVTPIPAEMIPLRRMPSGRPEGEAGDAWLYFDADGAPIMYRVRFNQQGGKVVVPLTYCKNAETGDFAWRWKDLPAPRPLYNVEKLKGAPDAPVLVVEGEKCADAGEELLGAAGWVVVTWPGGAKRAGKKDTDWTPLKGRKVWVWPDNDLAGREAALTIADVFKALDLLSPLIIRPDPSWIPGFDIADLKWTPAQVLEFIEKNSSPPQALRKEVVAKRGSASQGDLFVADRFLAKHEKDVRYCPTRGWLIWDGKRWAWSELEETIKMCEIVVRDLYREAADIENEDERAALVRFAATSSRIDRLRGALAVARTHVAVLQDDLDKGEYFLNCANGTVDLRDGSLAPADRDALITRLIDVEYCEDAPAERFERFLIEVFEGKTELIEYLQRAIGYSFTADLGEQCLHILHGTGANGKSTLIDVLLKVAGDYGQTAPAQMILTKFGAGIPTDIARLCGARMVAMSETGEARGMDEATVKTLTSVEPVPARFLHRDFFEFRPTHHLWLSSNHKPKIGGTDHGIWRRIRLIPFTQTFEINPTLHEELEIEIPGVLAWIVAGAVKWYREGLEIPLEISRATKAYRGEQDILDDFLKECCEEDSSAEILAKELYELYKNWAKESGEDLWSKKMLGRKLAERGFISRRESRTGSAEWGGLRQRYYSKD